MVRQGQDWRRVGLDDRHAFKRIDAASELNTQRAQRSFNSLISYPHGLTLASATLDHVTWSNHGAGQANFRRIHERKSRAGGISYWSNSICPSFRRILCALEEYPFSLRGLYSSNASVFKRI